MFFRNPASQPIQGLQVWRQGNPLTQHRIQNFDGDFYDLEDIIAELEQLRDETQEKFDSMPESLQQGDSGQLLEERVSELDDLISTLQAIEDPVFENDEEDADIDEEERLAAFREEVRNAV